MLGSGHCSEKVLHSEPVCLAALTTCMIRSGMQRPDASRDCPGLVEGCSELLADTALKNYCILSLYSW